MKAYAENRALDVAQFYRWKSRLKRLGHEVKEMPAQQAEEGKAPCPAASAERTSGEQEERMVENLSLKEKYEILRRQVEHEDSLVILRLNWLLVSQGFMFVAYAQVLTSEKVPDRLFPLVGIGVLSVFIGIFTLIGLSAAFNSLRGLSEDLGNPFAPEEQEVGEERAEAQSGLQLRDEPGGTRTTFDGISLRWVGAWYASGKTAAVGIVASLIFAWILLSAWTMYKIP